MLPHNLGFEQAEHNLPLWLRRLLLNSSNEKRLYPLFSARLASLSFGYSVYIISSTNDAIAQLGTEIAVFLEPYKNQSAEFYEARQTARELVQLAEKPNRVWIALPQLLIVVQFFKLFFQSETGQRWKRTFVRVWTYRP